MVYCMESYLVYRNSNEITKKKITNIRLKINLGYFTTEILFLDSIYNILYFSNKYIIFKYIFKA